MYNIHINNGIATASKGLEVILTRQTGSLNADDLYRNMNLSYPKFFKMDDLCKWSFLGAEMLLGESENRLYKDMEPDGISIVLATSSGCLQVDKKYAETMTTIPSPGLFVYTLPNIMLGELSIRHGFKGEQLCLVQARMNEEELRLAAEDLVLNRGMQAVLYGWADVTGGKPEIHFWWLSKNSKPR